MDHNLIAFPVKPKKRDAEPEPDARRRNRVLRHWLIAGFVLCAGLLAGTGGWLLLASMSHDSRGTQSAGSPQDPAMVKAELSLIVQEINDLSVRRARLMAERDEAEAIQLSDAQKGQLIADGGLLLLKSQEALLRNRRQARQQQKTLLRQRIEGIRDEITAMKHQEQGIRRQMALSATESSPGADRKALELVGFDSAGPAARRVAELQEKHGQIVADIARARDRITAVELQILQLEMRFRETVLGELAKVRDQLAILSRQRIAAQDRLRRTRPEDRAGNRQPPATDDAPANTGLPKT